LVVEYSKPKARPFRGESLYVKCPGAMWHSELRVSPCPTEERGWVRVEIIHGEKVHTIDMSADSQHELEAMFVRMRNP